MFETIYVPYFDRGWNIKTISAHDTTFIQGHSFNSDILYSGMLYNGDNMFSSEIGARDWINKNYFEARKYQVNETQVNFGRRR